MAIRAYDESYVAGAGNALGHAVDFAVLSLDIVPDLFGKAFAVSDISKQFARGNPRYVAGMNGCELARRVLQEANISFSETEDVMYLDKSPEYWAGWALAHLQWYSGRSFMSILKAVSLEKFIRMYMPYHEMDILQLAERLECEIKAASPLTKLRYRRESCGLSQSELSAEAEVPLRQIQMFEQRRRDINKTSAVTLLRLSRALYCTMEDLLEL
ncbi:helix-turn-helix transcriptional regulator [bacterium]|nr:helix-turn-helix transcriptional regulator [bacterium]